MSYTEWGIALAQGRLIRVALSEADARQGFVDLNHKYLRGPENNLKPTLVTRGVSDWTEAEPEISA